MLAMERLPLSQTSQFSNYYPNIGSPSVQSPRAAMPAGHFLPGLPSPPALHHTGHKQHIPRLGSGSSLHTPPPYDTAGLLSSCHPAVLYSPTALHPGAMIPPSSQDSTPSEGVLANLVAGHPPVSTTSVGGSSSESSVNVTSPREHQPSTSTQGMHCDH